MNSTHQRCLIVFFNLIIECWTPKTLPLWALKKTFNFSFRFASWTWRLFRVLKDLQPLILIDHLMLGARKIFLWRWNKPEFKLVEIEKNWVKTPPTHSVWKSTKKSHSFWRFFFWKPEACCQAVLSDRSILIGQKLVENAKTQMRHFDEFSNNVLYFLKWITIFEVAEKVIHNVIDIVITDRCLYCNWKRFFFLGLVFTCSSIIAVLQDWLCVLMSSPESNRIIVHFPFIFPPFLRIFVISWPLTL